MYTLYMLWPIWTTRKRNESNFIHHAKKKKKSVTDSAHTLFRLLMRQINVAVFFVENFSRNNSMGARNNMMEQMKMDIHEFRCRYEYKRWCWKCHKYLYIYVSMFSDVTLTHNIENYLFLNAINTNNIPHWVEKCYHLINNIMQMASTKNTKLKGVCS